MGNIALLTDKPSDAGTFSGGSWTAGLPLANLKTDDVQALARSTNALTSSTRFRVDLGSAQAPISTFALLNHNGSSGAKWRVVVTSDANDADPAARLLDTALLAMWEPTVVFGQRPWGAWPWDGIEITDYPGGPIAWHRHSTPVFGRYVWVYIEDPNNTAGYFQAGRFLAGQAWSPQTNVSYGATVGWIDNSEVTRTRGGRRLVTERPAYRQIAVRFEALTKAEALGVALDIERRIGRRGDFLLSLDPDDDPQYRHRTTIYAGKAAQSPPEATAYDTWSWSLTAEELI